MSTVEQVAHINARIRELELENALKAHIIETVEALWGPRLCLTTSASPVMASYESFAVIICSKLSPEGNTVYQAKAIAYKDRVGGIWQSLIHSADDHERVDQALEDLLASSQADLAAATDGVEVTEEYRPAVLDDPYSSAQANSVVNRENIVALWGHPRLRRPDAAVKFSIITCAKLAPDGVTTSYQAKFIGYRDYVGSSWQMLVQSVDNHPRVYLALEDLLAAGQADLGVATDQLEGYLI
ncbi:uncharacterized protein N0V89_006378 [Didymosphaeria variabile]|uniref:Uncharacterized protein n=1 Tax=Didymosphaeria variabile TaxID=1932322 RepID=A0A9W8XN46_9PLEO|nr:uncharacterized protein N0V89_006378 [Didymosphaeria variabile]KAJ4354641.1 hypothetical protein N0V89_006378 [Didymosphaeria variabile]